MAAFTASSSYDELIEDINNSSLSESIKELLVGAANKAREDMCDRAGSVMGAQINGLDNQKMIRYTTGIMTSTVVNRLIEDKMYVDEALDAKTWINAWTTRNR